MGRPSDVDPSFNNSGTPAVSHVVSLVLNTRRKQAAEAEVEARNKMKMVPTVPLWKRAANTAKSEEKARRIAAASAADRAAAKAAAEAAGETSSKAKTRTKKVRLQ